VSSVVLDASALLAILHREAGHEKAKRRLAGAAISAVNYSETLKKLVEAGCDLRTAQFHLENFALTVVPFDRAQAGITAELWTAGRKLGLSFADRACLALGMLLKADVITGDKRWKEADVGVTVLLFR
jgi:ribonuclease VapC